MGIILIILFLLTFATVISPFGKKKLDNSGQLTLTVTYTFYFILFLFFMYLALFQDLYLGYGLGDLFFYLIFSVAMILSNLGMGLRNMIGKELKYFFSGLNIMVGVYLIKTLLESNLAK